MCVFTRIGAYFAIFKHEEFYGDVILLHFYP